jgi:hypothetical protein
LRTAPSLLAQFHSLVTRFMVANIFGSDLDLLDRKAA